ncbi:MAG: reverse transcriptase domain-containing protein, partial [Kofleriaceae bacterium]
MQTLVELLIELKSLAGSLDDPKQLAKINKLFSNPRLPAEFQVGRHYLSRLLVPRIESQLDHLDPEQRKEAITSARTLLARSAAARLLRRVVKDPDGKVRAAARTAVRKLALDDVAPPDIRYKVDKSSPLGGHNPTGWAFGIFAHDAASARKVKKPTRPNALDQYALPKLASPEAVAKLVGVTLEDLPKLMRPGTEAGSGYVEFEVPKAKGGTRRIAAPRAPLRKVQRIILDQILAKVPLHDACHGFVPKRSTVTNAQPHQLSALVVKLDLKDFFPTVHYRRVKGLFVHLG